MTTLLIPTKQFNSSSRESCMTASKQKLITNMPKLRTQYILFSTANYETNAKTTPDPLHASATVR